MSELQRESVLVVDDEPQVLLALEDILAEDFTVLVADSGSKALELLGAVPHVAVVVTDQRMPAMSGDELLSRIRQTTDAVSILLTGFADLSAVVRAVNEGRLFAYATKPWDPDDLRLKVSKAAEHFRLNTALCHERKLLNDLMDSTPDAVYFKDRDLRYVRANSACVRYLGTTTEEVLGKRITELGVDAASALAMESVERRVLESQQESRDSLQLLRFGGTPRWFSTTKAPVRAHDGGIAGLVAIARDVTDRVLAVEQLKESESRFRSQSTLLNSILDCMGEGVIAVDTEGRHLVSNQRAERLLGRDALSAHPREWSARVGMFLPDQVTPLPPEKNVLVGAMQGAEPPELEVHIKNAHNPGAVVAISASPLEDAQGALAGGIALLRDVTQHRRLELELAQSQKMEAIGVLAGGIAHDFNNLLSVISSYCTFILDGLGDADPVREDVAEILEAGRRASALTRQLLAFSRKEIVQPKVLDLNTLVLDSEKLLGRILGEDIVLKTVVATSVGRVRGDAGQVEQVVLNLAVNARDAMPQGGNLTVETRDVTLGDNHADLPGGMSPGSYVMLVVSDTGTGMTPEVQQRIFEPFYTTKKPGMGTGLGLSTVYGIVRQSGGHLEVRSEVAVGTTFKVYFPRVDEEAEARSVSPNLPAPAETRATILLVEDNDDVRRIAARILRRCGYDVVDTGSPAIAREVCRDRGESIALLLTDVVMPETSGPKLVAELRIIYPQLRVLYMSGYPGGTALRGMSLPADVPYLAKPFTPSSLSEKVREVLRGEG